MTIEEIQQALATPFAPGEVKCKPGATSGNRALPIWYLTARAVMDRLDAVLGIGGWRDEYTVHPDGSVKCRLVLRLGDEWLAKEDVGGQSEQDDEGDRMKAAFSDGLKRAAVKFGVGRYLYSVPPVWCDWDKEKKRFAKDPQLPASALPGHKSPAKVAAAPANGDKPKGPTLPADGAELEQRLKSREAKLVADGLCQPGDLLTAVTTAGVKAGYVKELVRWPAAAMQLAADETTAFVAKCKAGEGPVHAS